jgi:mono/diheme cytochrome c family protein
MRFTATLVVFGIAVAAAAAQEAGNQSGASRTVWDGVYTVEQAQRGEEAYRAHCARCHRDDLGGYNGLLLGDRFMEKYREASLNLFFEKMRSTMPRTAPGSLDPDTYVDITSYILKVNAFPTGTRDLALAEIPGVRLIGKDGPAAVPNFSLVQVKGCLVQRGSDWLVTNSTEPVRTSNPQPDAGEVVVAENAPDGTATFELLSSAAYEPAKQAGHVIELRGFLIRRSNATHRINVTAITTAGPECAPAASQ